MFFKLIISLLIFNSNSNDFTLEKGIQRLKPLCTKKLKTNCITEKNYKMIINVIRTKAHKYGLTKKDYPVILSMMKKETNFRHIKGKHGEVGMLQVIPTENHIKRIVFKNITCKPTEKYCRKTKMPNIVYRKKYLSGKKTYRFLNEHPKYAIEAGLGEMRFWKKRYAKYNKRRFWKYFPKKYFQKRYGYSKYKENKEILKQRWSFLVRKVKNLLWVSHYNWGGRSLLLNPIARLYPYSVLKYYNKALGRNKKETFYVFKPTKNKKLTEDKIVENKESKTDTEKNDSENHTGAPH